METVALKVFASSATRPGSVACAGADVSAGSTAAAASSASSTGESGALLSCEQAEASEATNATAMAIRTERETE